jgi:hypothetical protein
MDAPALLEDFEQIGFCHITTPAQFRTALSQLRFLGDAAPHSPLARERDVLELAVSRYLAICEREYRTDRDVCQRDP